MPQRLSQCPAMEQSSNSHVTYQSLEMPHLHATQTTDTALSIGQWVITTHNLNNESLIVTCQSKQLLLLWCQHAFSFHTSSVRQPYKTARMAYPWGPPSNRVIADNKRGCFLKVFASYYWHDGRDLSWLENGDVTVIVDACYSQHNLRGHIAFAPCV